MSVALLATAAASDTFIIAILPISTHIDIHQIPFPIISKARLSGVTVDDIIIVVYIYIYTLFKIHSRACMLPGHARVPLLVS